MAKKRSSTTRKTPPPQPKKTRERPRLTGSSAETTTGSPEKLLRLPQKPEIWQTDCQQLPTAVDKGGMLVEPWIMLVVSPGNGLVLAHEIVSAQPDVPRIWGFLTETMAKRVAFRPKQVQVRPGSILDDLQPRLEAIGIDLVDENELDELDVILDMLIDHMTEDDRPGLLETPGVTPERVASFYRAAAEFYHKAPWDAVSDEEAIRIECNQLDGGPWYAIVMGWGGITVGLALFEDLNLLRRMWHEELDDVENAGLARALSVTFDSHTQIPAADLRAVRKHGWEVAGPIAYPWAFRSANGLTAKPPKAWELELLEGCLRAIPTFVAENRPREFAETRATVPVASGNLNLVLSWVDEE
jgi:hypothetical protein